MKKFKGKCDHLGRKKGEITFLIKTRVEQDYSGEACSWDCLNLMIKYLVEIPT